MIIPAYRYRATCPRVIDGDSFVLNVDLGFRVTIQIHGRLRGVNAPELSTDAGKAAKQFVMDLIGPLTPLVIESYKDQQSFSRWIVDVYVGGESLANILLAEGHAA